MKPVLFDFQDYKPYLLTKLDLKRGLGKGGRTRLCEAMGCQTAYLSQVLNGAAHLSLEQGDAVNRFLNHREDESEYFLLLIQAMRSGTENLRKFTHRQLEKIRTRREHLKGRIPTEQRLSLEHQIKYYSAWYYAAIHVLVTIPEFRTVDAISKKLNLNPSQTSKALEFLVSRGLLKRKNSEFEATTKAIHLGDDSDLVAKYHVGWRVQAMRSIEQAKPGALNYSSVVTLSQKDATEIRDQLLRAIESAKTIISDSPPEMIHCLSVDWFSI